MLEVLIENADFQGEVVQFPLSADGRTIIETIRALFPGYTWIQSRELPVSL